MILGVTGGIGSGKTTVCKVFNVLGIPVFLTDIEAKILMDTDLILKEKLNSVAGKDLYLKGTLDRAILADIIFSDKKVLEKVNSLVHPMVFENFRKWVSLQESPYVIMESAILFESGGSKLVDKIASVIAPVEERIERVSKRNNLAKPQILERIANQMTDEDRIRLSDFIISNSEQEMIIPAIINVHNNILESLKTESL
jgi:dephospho-CoA kinase